MSFTPYIIHLLILIGIYSILSVSYNLALGYTGLLNLGHIAFFGIGAYTSALLVKAGIPYFVAIISAGIMAAFFGFLLIVATARLKGDYLALATLGFNFVVYSVLLNWTSLTRGPLGIAGIPKPSFFGFTISSNLGMLLFVALLTFITVYVIYKIVTTHFGKLLEAVRDDELGLKVLGKNTFVLKAKAMIISAFFAGIAGSLFAHYITYIDPSSFMLTEIILILTIVIIGGIASVKGSIVGTIIVLLIPEALRFLSLPSSIIGPLRQIIFTVILLAILMYKPRGLFGRIDLDS